MNAASVGLVPEQPPVDPEPLPELVEPELVEPALVEPELVEPVLLLLLAVLPVLELELATEPLPLEEVALEVPLLVEPLLLLALLAVEPAVPLELLLDDALELPESLPELAPVAPWSAGQRCGSSPAPTQ